MSLRPQTCSKLRAGPWPLPAHREHGSLGRSRGSGGQEPRGRCQRCQTQQQPAPEDLLLGTDAHEERNVAVSEQLWTRACPCLAAGLVPARSLPARGPQPGPPRTRRGQGSAATDLWARCGFSADADAHCRSGGRGDSQGCWGTGRLGTVRGEGCSGAGRPGTGLGRKHRRLWKQRLSPHPKDGDNGCLSGSLTGRTCLLFLSCVLAFQTHRQK